MGEKRFARVLGYARVSSLEQALGTSLTDQQASMSAYAAGRGLKVAKFFVESESAVHERIERRQEMRALLAAVKSGDLILCDKLDRWSRDPEFSYRSIREILAAGASFYAVGDACDPSTAEGDTALGFRILFAREEAKRIRQRLVGTRKLLRDRGLYSEGGVPLGYRRQDKRGPERIERNVLVLDEKEAALVRDIFRQCVEGKSIEAIALDLDLKRDRVFDVLHRRLYLGEIQKTDGTWIRGQHPAIVDARTWQRAQDALSERSKGSRSPQGADVQTRDWWLRDVARCARCGEKLTSAYGKELSDGSRHYYLRCRARCGAGYVPVKEAHEDCEILVWDRLMELKEELARPPTAPKARPGAAGLAERRSRLEARRQRYTEAYADGGLTREELRARLARLDAERTRLDAEAVTPPAPTTDERRAALKVAAGVVRAWIRLPGAARRLVMNTLAVRVMLAADKVPKPVWRDVAELDLKGLGETLAAVDLRRK